MQYAAVSHIVKQETGGVSGPLIPKIDSDKHSDAHFMAAMPEMFEGWLA